MVVMKKREEKQKCHVRKCNTIIKARKKHLYWSSPPNLRTAQGLMTKGSTFELNTETTYFTLEPHHL
jgi:hypothetical protein